MIKRGKLFALATKMLISFWVAKNKGIPSSGNSVGHLAFKKELFRPVPDIVSSQILKLRNTEYGVPVLISLGTLYVDQHSITVDIGNMQV